MEVNISGGLSFGLGRTGTLPWARPAERKKKTTVR